MPEWTLPSTEIALGPHGRRSLGWWGVGCLIATEGALFVLLLFAYYYVAAQNAPQWPPGEPPRLRLALPNTLILILSSAAVWWGELRLRRGYPDQAAMGLATAFALGAVFLVIQALEWRSKTFSPSSHAYGAFYFTITGFHMAHVAAGLIGLGLVFLWIVRRRIDHTRTTPMLGASAYWHFVDLVWLAVFFTFYIAPRTP